jgi:aspartate/methionine/tyrosine aminotransferase
MPVLEKIAAKGVLLAPGSAFGDACKAHARLCFTGVDEARLDEGIDRINGVLASWRSIG